MTSIRRDDATVRDPPGVEPAPPSGHGTAPASCRRRGRAGGIAAWAMALALVATGIATTPPLWAHLRRSVRQPLLRGALPPARARGETAPRLLDTLPRSLPALRRALTVQPRRVAAVGFEWETAEQVGAKIVEETEELRQGVQVGDPRRIEDELGDMLFSVINLGRFLGVDPEAALQSTVSKFVQRFGRVEDALRARGRTLEDAKLQEMDAHWEAAKRLETAGAVPPDSRAPGPTSGTA